MVKSHSLHLSSSQCRSSTELELSWSLNFCVVTVEHLLRLELGIRYRSLLSDHKSPRARARDTMRMVMRNRRG